MRCGLDACAPRAAMDWFRRLALPVRSRAEGARVIIESVTVRRYRAVEEATLDLAALTYLVGRNGAGKSTFLNALGVFFGAVPVQGEADFYGHETTEPIEIVVAFTALSADAEAEFAKYVRDSRLLVTRRFRYDAGRVTDGGFYGVTGQYPDFAEVRRVEGRERVSAYAALRDRYGLPAARSVAAVDAALLDWEERHPGDLELTQDDGKFFGYRNVAAGKLDRFIDFVLVPAVRDASSDAADGRDSALRRLVDAVISRSVAFEAPLTQLSQTVASEYEALLARPDLSLKDLQDRMSRSIQQFAPGASVDLSWGTVPDVRLVPPSPLAKLTDDGFTSDVASKGHGLQRAYMMAALQALAEVEATRAMGNEAEAPAAPRGLLLAVEEPELFQHPSQARFIAKTFSGLTADPARQVQILACTHSPIFIDVRTFDSLRRVRKQRTNSALRVSVMSASLDAVARRLEEVHRRATGSYTGMGLRPGLVALMNPYVNEALFADFVVLVEGEEDKALLEAALTRAERWNDIEARAFAVVPVGGKTLLDRMAAILSLFEIPHFLVFDRDAEPGHGDEEVRRWNRVLGELAGVEEPDEMPETGCGEHHAVFAPTVTKVVEEELGRERWIELRGVVCQELGIEERANSAKNREVLSKMLTRAAEEGLTSPSLERAAEAILHAVRRDLDGAETPLGGRPHFSELSDDIEVPSRTDPD
jgi:putative ATP-dependent endonuclease of the OLD family